MTLLNLSSKEVIRIIERDGWLIKRIKGSHHHFQHSQKKGLVTVPHPKKEIDKKTLKSIISQAGLSANDFSAKKNPTILNMPQKKNTAPKVTTKAKTKTNPVPAVAKTVSLSPAARTACKAFRIAIKKTGNKFEYKTSDGKIYLSFQKAVEAAKRLISRPAQATNGIFSKVKTAAAKRLMSSQLKGIAKQRDKAKKAFADLDKKYNQASSVAQMTNGKRRRKNSEVDGVYEMFQGRSSTDEFEAVAPNGTPDELAELGMLCWVEIADFNGDYSTLSFETPNNQAPVLCADTRGNLHIVGGTYRMPEQANATLGNINRIAYETHKDHIGDGKVYEFVHEFSEVTGGDQPNLKIDKDGLFKIVGGVYTLTSAGIED
jgi:predicted RNA binding protein YcfA (HicA-like mRNA interferase family)